MNRLGSQKGLDEAQRAVKLAIAALQPPEEPDFVFDLDGIEYGIVLDVYSETPPTGRCLALCETPEDYYGETNLEYRIVSVFTDSSHEPHYNLRGDDIDTPPDVNDGDIYNTVLEWAKDGWL